eukprot:g7158.t1
MAAIKYDADYSESGVTALLEAIAPLCTETASDVPGLETTRLYETLKHVHEEWHSLGDFETLDRKFQALLAVAAATSWFTKEQLDDIDGWLNEVADCGETEDWMQNFPEDDLRDVVLDNLRAREVEITFDSETRQNLRKQIATEHVNAQKESSFSCNFGTGRHDGSIHLDDDGLTIKDSRHPGMSTVWLGDLPEDPEQLGQCLQSRNWDEHFFRAIDARDAAGFGIRKLSLLDVDSLHEAPECITWEHRISLLYYAAWRKRDHFVSAS